MQSLTAVSWKFKFSEQKKHDFLQISTYFRAGKVDKFPV